MHQKDGTHTVLPCWAMLLIPVARQIPVKICAAESTQRFWRAATSHIDTWNIMKCTILFSYLWQDDENASNNNFSKMNLVDWCHAKICQAPKVTMKNRCLQDLAGSERASRTGAQAEHLTTWETMGSRWKRGETWGYQESNGEWRAYNHILDHGSYRMILHESPYISSKVVVFPTWTCQGDTLKEGANINKSLLRPWPTSQPRTLSTSGHRMHQTYPRNEKHDQWKHDQKNLRFMDIIGNWWKFNEISPVSESLPQKT